MGLFAKPTAPMKKEAASSGVLDTPFGKFARLQIITIEDLFAGKKPAMPPEGPAAFITQNAFRRLTRPSATVRLHLPSTHQIQHSPYPVKTGSRLRRAELHPARFLGPSAPNPMK